MDDQPNSRTTNGLTTPLPDSLPTSSQGATASQETAEKLVALARLQSHFYQPGQTSQQIRAVLEDMLDDLKEYSPQNIERACKYYRSNPENRFFPTSGQLIGALTPPKTPTYHRLETHTAEMYQAAEASKPAKFLSVSEVLRKHGRHDAADRWAARPGTAL